jgi:hypothetical protein
MQHFGTVRVRCGDPLVGSGRSRAALDDPKFYEYRQEVLTFLTEHDQVVGSDAA